MKDATPIGVRAVNDSKTTFGVCLDIVIYFCNETRSKDLTVKTPTEDLRARDARPQHKIELQSLRHIKLYEIHITHNAFERLGG